MIRADCHSGRDSLGCAKLCGGITWADAEYDERLGEVLRPMKLDTSGIPMGFDMRNDIKEMISQAFYLNKIGMPPVDRSQMTAYEVGQRVQEYIRNALPLFEPMEMDYNGAVCDRTFEVMLRNGGFGRVEDMPQTLRGKDIRFKFESPLHQAIEKQKARHGWKAKPSSQMRWHLTQAFNIWLTLKQL